MSKQRKHPARGVGHSGANPDPDAPFVIEEARGEVGEGQGPRVLRLERLFFEELDRLFRLEVSDPRLASLAIARVQLSPDLRNAKVYYARRDAVPGRPAGLTPGAARVREEAQMKTIHDGLVRVTPFLRARLSDVVQMKRLPDLHFHRDRDAEAALRATQQFAPPAATSS
ncbi:MAG TPA: ribosome-binding factor A [Pseudomonadota bacterium]|nr:ribosome-binding factor A [Pseudomonadota bacterium]